MNRLRSFRDFVERLLELGEVQPIDVEVDWDLEIGAIIRRSYDLGAPAPLFSRIKDSQAGFRVLGAPAGVSRQPGLALCRVAVALGLEASAGPRAIVEALASAHGRAPVPPRRVASGPCKENILRGRDVDLTRLPVPLIHSGDGGRYVNTWGTVIAKSPDGEWTNWCITRVMLRGPRSMVGLVAPRQHLGLLLAQWRALGQPMPFALALGTEPAVPFVSAMPLREGVSEAAFLGGYFGEPVDVVAAETVPLDVPATAEIVIEGTISDTETAPEGPMGEYAGYLSGASAPAPVFNVSAITHRNAAILPVVASGEPVEEDHTCWGVAIAATVLADLHRAGFPVGTVWSPLESAVHWLVVTVDRARRDAFTREALVEAVREVVFPSKAGRVISKVLLVDDDVDPSNLRELVWAFATRCHPARGNVLFEGVPVTPLQPYLDAHERRTGVSAKVVHDCLWPDGARDHHRRVSFRGGWPAEVQARVLAQWQRYGYPQS